MGATRLLGCKQIGEWPGERHRAVAALQIAQFKVVSGTSLDIGEREEFGRAPFIFLGQPDLIASQKLRAKQIGVMRCRNQLCTFGVYPGFAEQIDNGFANLRVKAGVNFVDYH